MKRAAVLGCACVVMLSLGFVVHANFADEQVASPYAAVGEPEMVQAQDVAGAEGMEAIAKSDPAAFLEKCLERYRDEVKGYRTTFHKRERIGGKLNNSELIDVCFRESPHSVCMVWKEGARLAERSLYVDGQNNNKLLVRPNGKVRRLAVGDVVERDVDGSDAKQSGRYTLDQFGLRKSTERVLATWKAAKQNGTLKVTYKGIEKVPMAGNRPCYHLHRVCASPEHDGIMEHTVYIDTDTWLLAGSRSTGKNGELIGEYYFRDIQLNPSFDAEQLTRKALIP